MTDTVIHDALVQWATDTQNVTISGVRPTSFPHKGLGMAATHSLKVSRSSRPRSPLSPRPSPAQHTETNSQAGAQLIHVPAASLLTVHPDLPPPAQATLSLHGRLALALTFPSLSPQSVGNRDLLAWKRILPSPSSLRASMPALWPASLQAHLPSAAAKLLAKQRAKLDADAAVAASSVLAEYAAENDVPLEECKQQYALGWLLVNTRCFYWDYPVFGGALAGKPKTRMELKRGADGKVKRLERGGERERDDCMAMCPVLDYFNHGDGDGVSAFFGVGECV